MQRCITFSKQAFQDEKTSNQTSGAKRDRELSCSVGEDFLRDCGERPHSSGSDARDTGLASTGTGVIQVLQTHMCTVVSYMIKMV